jgi:hypothetical protein
MKNSIAFLGLIALSFACATGSKSPSPTPSASPAAAPAAAKTAEPKKAAAGEVNCVSGEDKRVLAIAAKGEGCELNYTKQGETKVVATSGNGTRHCEDTQTKIRTKLEVSGFACK